MTEICIEDSFSDDNQNFQKFDEFDFCTEDGSTSNPTTDTSVGISNILAITGGMKVILTDGRQFSFAFPPAQNGLDGQDGEDGLDGQDGESIAVISSSSEEVGNYIRVTIVFSDETSINIDIPKGAKGDKGDTGENANFFYSSDVDPSPVIGNDDDLYLNYQSGDLFKKVESTWEVVSNVKGTKGDDGQNGSKIYRGEGEPTGSSLENDYYIDTSVMSLYEFVSGSWVLAGSLKGDKGDKGDTGDVGGTGVAGADGADGQDGRSIQVFVQTSEPAGGTYFDGDIWIIE